MGFRSGVFGCGLWVFEIDLELLTDRCFFLFGECV